MQNNNSRTSTGSISWLITDYNITVNYQGQTHIVSRSDKLSDRLIDAIKSDRLDEIPNLVSTAKRVENFSDGNFTVKGNSIFIQGVEVPRVLGDKIVQFANEGLPYQPLIKFAENLQKNPSYRAVNELYQFLDKNNHPITENGCFIAYKKVRSDFKDGFSGTLDNSPGQIVEMPRNKVNEDCSQTCSYGLHCANWHYAYNVYDAGPGSIMLELEVNPADVVSVPIDYDSAKIRVCRYKVLGVVSKESTDSALKITNPSSSNLNNKCCKDCCKDCGEELTSDKCDCNDDDYCNECGDLLEDCCCDEEFENECPHCGELDCYNDECLEENEDEEFEDEEEDKYPWEDELK